VSVTREIDERDEELTDEQLDAIVDEYARVAAANAVQVLFELIFLCSRQIKLVQQVYPPEQTKDFKQAAKEAGMLFEFVCGGLEGEWADSLRRFADVQSLEDELSYSDAGSEAAREAMEEVVSVVNRRVKK
jgi:hypothetical protein